MLLAGPVQAASASSISTSCYNRDGRERWSESTRVPPLWGLGVPFQAPQVCGSLMCHKHPAGLSKAGSRRSVQITQGEECHVHDYLRLSWSYLFLSLSLEVPLSSLVPAESLLGTIAKGFEMGVDVLWDQPRVLVHYRSGAQRDGIKGSAQPLGLGARGGPEEQLLA